MSHDQLPEGYKQTETGVIPENWNVITLGEILTFQNGVNADKSFYGHGIPFINISEVMAHTHLKASDIPGLVSLSKQAIDLYRVYQGDILFNRTSEVQEELGLTSVYLDNEVVVFGGFVIRGRQKTEALDITYSSYALRSSSIRTQITSRGQGVVRANIGQKDLSEIQVCVPPISEQRSIAQALSDVDRLIAALEKTIGKKRAIKTATMQQLLTGRKRLPGFGEGRGYQESAIGVIPEDWNIRRIKDVAPLQRGFDLPTSRLQKGDYPVVYSNGVMNHHSSFMVNSPGVITGRSGTIGNVHYVSENYWPHNTALWVTEFIDSDPKYIFYLYKSIKLERFGTGSGVPTLNRNDVHDLVVGIPKLPEQRSIATVLSDMDTAIAAIETRLAKTQALKQGMMQALLTGRVRLKIET